MQYLQGKAGEIFRPEGISNVKITNVPLKDGLKRVVTTFTDNYLTRYSQECCPDGKIITRKTHSYGVQEVVVECADGQWSRHATSPLVGEGKNS